MYSKINFDCLSKSQKRASATYPDRSGNYFRIPSPGFHLDKPRRNDTNRCFCDLVIFKFCIFLMCICITQNCLAADETVEASFVSWSGYWWPSNIGGLGTGLDYNGTPAPLQKYDMLMTGTYYGNSTNEYLAQYYDPSAPMWYGLCGAFAAAASVENIDFVPSVVDNILFRVGDKKGLITLAHDLDWLYGVRVNCDTPDILHYWLLNYIKDQGKPFYADLDPTEQVWNYPVYKFSMSTTEGPGVLNVKCTIWYANDLVAPDFIGTDARVSSYEYRLYLTDGVVTGGDWTGNSVTGHPQQLILPVEQRTTNTSLDYQKVKSIALSRDDELESDLPVSISPGDYRLLLLNEDLYLVQLEDGSEARLCMRKNDGDDDLFIEVSGNDGSSIYSGILSEQICLSLYSEKAPYSIKVSKSDYTDLSLYSISFDLKKQYEYVNPKIMKGDSWGGLAIVNNRDQTVSDLFFSAYGKSGQPIQTLLGPFSLAPKEKKVILLSDMKVRNVDRDELQGIKLISPDFVNTCYLSGSSSKNLAALEHSSPSHKLVMPDTLLSNNSNRNISWGLYNPSLLTNQTNLKLYEKNGALKTSTSVDLEPKAMHNYRDGLSSPFTSSADDGWIMVEGQQPLNGYEQWIDGGGSKSESLPFLKTGKEFAVPHTITSGFWDTGLVLINTTEFRNQITLRLVNGETVDEKVLELAPFEKRRMYIKNVFPGTSADIISGSSMLIKSINDMAGYFSFETPNDVSYFRLIDISEKKNTLVVPHSAVTGDWWTGITLFNPNNESVELTLRPIGNNGQALNNNISHTLPGLSKFVFTVSDLFGIEAESIAFIEVTANINQGFMGIYGMGDPNCIKLSGGVLE